jgi:hypothetical protein
MHAVSEGHIPVVKALLGMQQKRKSQTGSGKQDDLDLDLDVKDVHDLWTPIFHAVQPTLNHADNYS